MVSELEGIKKIEQELLKVRLTITEEEQKKEKAQKSSEALTYGGGFFIFLTFCAFFAENKLIAIFPGVIAGILVFFSFKKSFVISKAIRAINLAKKKKKQLENRLENLNYLAKVKAKKGQG